MSRSPLSCPPPLPAVRRWRQAPAVVAAVLAGVLALSPHARAQVFPVEPIEKGFFISSDPSPTLYWAGQNAKALLLFIPGGDGHLRLKPQQTDHRYQFYQMLKGLTQPERTRGHFDVVLLDSPGPLSPQQPYPAARTASDHLVRIESAIRYYKNKTGLPIWLMGHSNGGISLTAFLRHLDKKGELGLVQGVIASGIRNESDFAPPTHFPMLFLHHENDGCSHTRYAVARALYEKIQPQARQSVAFVPIQGGSAEAGHPCSSGYHMYFGASEEAVRAINDFMTRMTP